MIAAQWVQTNGLFGRGDIRSLTLHNGNIFATTGEDRICKSTDNGINWIILNPNLSDLHFVFENKNNLFISAYYSFYRSTDSGHSWTEDNSGLRDLTVYALVEKDSVIFAGTDNGVFISVNNGAFWSARNSGFPIGSQTYVHSLLVIADTIFASSDKGLFRSTDNGNNWVSINQDMKSYHLSSIGTSLLANSRNQILLSNDNGVSWSHIDSSLSGNPTINAIVGNDSSLFVATNNGIFISKNRGINWQAINSGLNFTQVQCMAIQNNLLYAGTTNGLFISPDNGNSWAISSLKLIYNNISSLSADGNIIYANTKFGGTFSSVDNGTQWTQLNPVSPNVYISELKVFDNYYIASTNRQFFISTNGQFFISTNKGTTWTEIAKKSWNNWVAIGKNIVATTTSGYIPPGAFFTGDIYVSKDTCKNWIAAHSDDNNTRLYLFAADRGQLICSSTNSGDLPCRTIIYKSIDSGVTWSNICTLNVHVSALATKQGLFLAGTNNNGILLSANNGLTWTPANSGLPDTIFDVNSFAVDSLMVYAAIYDMHHEHCVYSSNNNGSTWVKCSNGLPLNARVNSLKIFENYIYAGTDSNGLWRSPLLQTNIKKYPQSTSDVPLFHLRPILKSCSAALIDFYLPHRERIIINCYSLSGTNVTTIANGEMEAGVHQLRWDIRNIASGYYFLKFKAGPNIFVNKCLVFQ
jgi:photosystem II stability/assembly factor-like uncharacterized protein